MISNVFYFVLNMSLIAACITLLILVYRVTLRRYFPMALSYILWGIVFIRMLIPVAVRSPLSILVPFSKGFVKSVPLTEVSEKALQLSAANTIQGAKTYFPMEYKTAFIESLLKISGYIWLTGMLICILLLIILYVVIHQKLRKANAIKTNHDFDNLRKRLNIRHKIPMYHHDMITSPIVYGILKPSIILPNGIAIEDLDLLLLHEMVHIKRWDNLWKFLSILAVCIHWFNPFAWLSFNLLNQDMEHACDEKVLALIGSENKKKYATILTEYASRSHLPLTAFGHTATKSRILNILDYKKVSRFMLIFSCIVCIGFTLVLLTNP